ncbi:MAG: hypothetical protein ACI4XH_09380, partial [Acutalibacteraceae bacterium]
YQKARIIFKESKEFNDIENLYKKTMRKLKFYKLQMVILLAGIFGIDFLIIIFCLIMSKISG